MKEHSESLGEEENVLLVTDMVEVRVSGCL